jgi:hypothetical protein
MSRVKKSELDSELYEGMSEDEVKEAIVKNLRRKQQASVDLKAFREGCNAVITEMDERNEMALDYLSQLRGELPIEVRQPELDRMND